MKNLIKSLILTLTLTALTACGDDESLGIYDAAKDAGVDEVTPGFDETKSDSRLAPYLSRFDAIFSVSSDFPIAFSQRKEVVEALCQGSVTGHGRILVNEAFWKNASEIIKEIIVFREAARCAWGAQYNNDSVGIMNTTTARINQEQYRQYRKIYLSNLEMTK